MRAWWLFYCTDGLGCTRSYPAAYPLPRPFTDHRARGRRQEQINIATGEREAFIARSEGEKAAINKVQGEAESIKAVAEAIERLANAIRQPGSEQAVQLKVAEKAVDTYSQVASDATTTLIVPSNMTEVSALVSSAMKMIQANQRNVQPLPNVPTNQCYNRGLRKGGERFKSHA